MKERTNAEKVLFFILDALLIMGAILGVLTIDRGRWIASLPAFYQSPDMPLEGSALTLDAPTGSGVEGDASLIPQTGGMDPVQDLWR